MEFPGAVTEAAFKAYSTFFDNFLNGLYEPFSEKIAFSIYLIFGIYIPSSPAIRLRAGYNKTNQQWKNII